MPKRKRGGGLKLESERCFGEDKGPRYPKEWAWRCIEVRREKGEGGRQTRGRSGERTTLLVGVTLVLKRWEKPDFGRIARSVQVQRERAEAVSAGVLPTPLTL